MKMISKPKTEAMTDKSFLFIGSLVEVRIHSHADASRITSAVKMQYFYEHLIPISASKSIEALRKTLIFFYP